MSGQLRRDLGRDRALAERHCNEYRQLITTFPAPWDIKARAKFKACLAKLERDFNAMEESWRKWREYIDGLDDENEHDTEADLYNEWKENQQYVQCDDDLSDAIAEINAYMEVPWTPAPVAAPSIAGSSEDEDDEDFTPIQLSSLNIPKFDGDYTKWNSFWELFDLFIHQRKHAAVSKLAALRSLLQGNALAEIEGFTISGANYDTVVKTLKDRFGNEQFVIRELENKLDSFPPAKPNAASIGSTVTAVTNLCRQL
uniref:Uncharacterized protein n=1 Tax=Panagrolaimus davidi TaxID=227884 RepID=A0A914PC66_9BILA